MNRSSRIPALLMALGACALIAAGCGSSDDDSSSTAATTTAAAAPAASTDSATNLKDVCPSTVVIQTDWNPVAGPPARISTLTPVSLPWAISGAV